MLYIPSPGTKGIIPGITNNIAGYFNFLAKTSLIQATTVAAKKLDNISLLVALIKQ